MRAWWKRRQARKRRLGRKGYVPTIPVTVNRNLEPGVVYLLQDGKPVARCDVSWP